MTIPSSAPVGDPGRKDVFASALPIAGSRYRGLFPTLPPIAISSHPQAVAISSHPQAVATTPIPVSEVDGGDFASVRPEHLIPNQTIPHGPRPDIQALVEKIRARTFPGSYPTIPSRSPSIFEMPTGGHVSLGGGMFLIPSGMVTSCTDRIP